MRRTTAGAALAMVTLVGAVSAPASGTVAAVGHVFVDPTARLVHPEHIQLGDDVFVAPFASLVAGDGPGRRILVGDGSDVQDGVVLDARAGSIGLGELTELAHGSTVIGPADIGETGSCEDPDLCFTFVGFNAEVDGATVERDAMVLHLARVAPGVTIPSGRKVLPGKSVDTQAEVATETAEVTEADRLFMEGVATVNIEFADVYGELAADRASNVRGINYDPGHSDFNPDRDLPTIGGRTVHSPGFRNRIVGDITLADPLRLLDQVMASRISLRADEGEPFEVGTIEWMAGGVTLHALEHTSIDLGDGGRYGFHSLVHGGPTEWGDVTVTGDGFVLGAYAVFFRSRIGDDSRIGRRSLVQSSDLPDGTVIPPRVIVIGNEVVGVVEW